jgi:hypothetical protein
MLTGAITGFSGKQLPLFPLHLTPIFKPLCLVMADRMHQSGQAYKADDRLISDQPSLFPILCNYE